jgi:hypothetical protein
MKSFKFDRINIGFNIIHNVSTGKYTSHIEHRRQTLYSAETKRGYSRLVSRHAHLPASRELGSGISWEPPPWDAERPRSSASGPQLEPSSYVTLRRVRVRVLVFDAFYQRVMCRHACPALGGDTWLGLVLLLELVAEKPWG